MEKPLKLQGKGDEISTAYLLPLQGGRGTPRGSEIGVILREHLKRYDDLSFHLELMDDPLF